jgi:TolB protein
MDADGSNLLQLTKGPVDNFSPAWSPDGKYLAFTSDRNDIWEIWRMNGQGTDQQRITHPPASSGSIADTNSSWSPDSRFIVFETNRNGVFTELYIVTVDGQNLYQLTSPGDQDRDPAWAPK